MSLLKASNKGIISCLTVASLSLAIIHTPVEASGGESSNTTTKSYNELGASYIEIDLQRTKDGHLVAMHDEHMHRTTRIRHQDVSH